jgi:hypothetical protein
MFEPNLHQTLSKVLKLRGFKQAGHIVCVQDMRNTKSSLEKLIKNTT